MKLRSLSLSNVRRFAGTTAAVRPIADGITVIAAPNEHGKSTFFDALQALFFLPHGSQATEARALRAYSGGSPEVGAEIETEAGRFHVEKRFFSGRHARVTDLGTGRLIAQDDAAEAWIGRTIAGGGGPAGLLWVRQGVLALDPPGRSAAEKSERTDMLAARRDLLSSVAGEVEAMTGGRRMDVVIARCAQALDALATAGGKPRAGGPWKAAQDEAAALRAEAAELTEMCRVLREKLDERRGVEREFETLNNPQAEADRLAELEAARAAFAAARNSAEQRQAAQTGLALAQAKLGAATQALTEHDAADERAAGAAAALEDARGAEASAIGRLDAARAAEARAEAERKTAEAALEAARQLIARANRDALARAAAERLAGLESRLAQAEAQRQAQEEAAATARAISVRERHITAAEAAEHARDLARARRDAGAATLSVAYLPSMAARIRFAGEPLPHGATRQIVAPTVLDLPGIGQVTLTPGEEAGAPAADLANAEEDLRRALAALGAQSLTEARALLARKNAALDQARIAEAQLNGAAPEGVAELRGEVAKARTAIAEAPKDAVPLSLAESRLAEAEPAARRAQAALIAAQERRGQTAQAVAAAQAAREGAERGLDESRAALGPAETRATRRATLLAAVEDHRAGEAAERAGAEALARSAPDLENAAAELARAEGAVKRAAEARSRLSERRAALGAHIHARAEDGIEERLSDVTGRLAAAEARAARYADEARALARLRDALQAARTAARDRYFQPVAEELSPLLALLYEGGELTMDPETLLPRALTRDGIEEELDVLSSGTREQIAILTRLAFARLLARSGRPTPVILDDALVFSDDERIARMFTALHRIGRDQQIIVFTCRQRAFAGLGGAWPTITCAPAESRAR